MARNQFAGPGFMGARPDNNHRSKPMNRTSPYRRLLTAALCFTLPLGGAACNPAPSETELVLGEAAAFLTTSEESGVIGADAMAGTSLDTLSPMAIEDAETYVDGSPDSGAVCDFSARRQEVLERYDANRDGRLDRTEFQALRADLTGQTHPRFSRLGLRMRMWAFWRVRWAFDENGDRQLSLEERTALVDAMEARCHRLHQQALEKYDANGDGKLDEAELQVARDARRAAFLRKHQELLARYDTNGNGFLDFTERAQLREDRIAAARAHRQAVLAQYDTNGDGHLSVEEALPLRKEIQRRIIEGHNAH
jgi:Ca2+-binding EF-hand superfamily protein